MVFHIGYTKGSLKETGLFRARIGAAMVEGLFRRSSAFFWIAAIFLLMGTA